MEFSTCDLCDANEDLLASGALRVLPPVFRPYGARLRFGGPVATLKVFEDNVLVRAALEAPGQGRVLVIDGGGSQRCALVGGNLGVLAARNGWAGIVVDGCVRDVTELSTCDVGILAIGAHPRRSIRKGAGSAGMRIDIAGVAVQPGDWLYADADGVLVCSNKLG